MRGTVPRDPSCCSRCKLEGVCDDHKGPEGRPTLYEGPDVYEPSDWVQTVVGSAYQGYSYDDRRCRVWRCFGYDPRHGFWMRTIDIGDTIEVNISERAINRTFHEVE